MLRARAILIRKAAEFREGCACSKLVAFPLLVASTGLLFIDDIPRLIELEHTLNFNGEVVAAATTGWFLLTILWSPLDGEAASRVPAGLLRVLGLVQLACATGRLALSAHSPHNYPYFLALHWARETIVLLLAVDEALRLCYHQWARRAKHSSSAGGPIDFVNSPFTDKSRGWLHAFAVFLLVSTIGVGMAALPWINDATADGIGSSHLNSTVDATLEPWWAPNVGSGETMTELLAYGVFSLILVICAISTVSRDTEITFKCTLFKQTKSQNEWPYEHPDCEICRYKYSVKMEILIFLTVTRYLLSMALCATMLGGGVLTGAPAIITALIGLLDNSLGLWLFLGFAIHAGIPPMPPWLAGCTEWLASHATSVSSASGHEPADSNADCSSARSSPKKASVEPAEARALV